jgi:hypothetical protein
VGAPRRQPGEREAEGVAARPVVAARKGTAAERRGRERMREVQAKSADRGVTESQSEWDGSHGTKGRKKRRGCSRENTGEACSFCGITGNCPSVSSQPFLSYTSKNND